MAVALSLLPYMWKAWWRKLEQKGVWHGANTTMVMGMAFFGLIAILVGSIVAIKSLRHDSLAQGMMILEANLSAVMMGWLFIPIMVGSTTAEGHGVQPTRMGQFPLSNFSLLSIGMMSRLVQPVYWILLGTSLISLIPLLVVTNPVLGMVAGILFLIFSAMLAWSVELFSSAIFTSRRGREIMMIVALLVIVPIVALINGDFSTTDGDIIYSLGDHSVLLFSEDGSAGLMTKTRALTPSVWVSQTAQKSGVAPSLWLLVLAAGLSCWLAVFSLRRVMLHPPSSLVGRKSTGSPIGVPRGLSYEMGPMVVKELRYLTRTLDHLMGVGMGLIGLAWILIRPEHMVFVLPLGVINIVFNESAIPLNNFGLDGPGADRYRLLPLSGRQVVLAKNLAYFLVVGIHIAPLLLAGVFSGGAGLALIAVLATAAICLLTTVGGNIASINSPAPRAFFNFDTKEQTGGTLALIFAGLLWLLPVGVYFGLVWVGTWAAVLGMTVLLLVAMLIYRSTIDAAGKRFDNTAEKMRERLSEA